MSLLNTPHQFFNTSDGIRLAYRDYGSGKPLLCLSGLTRNSSDFTFLADALDTSSNRLICLDYRGRGASGHAPAHTYDVPTEARDSLELLDHLNIGQAPIIGTSRGGLIAMTIAALAKDRLSGICLNDIGPEIAPEGIAAINTYLGKSPPFKTYAEAAEIRAALPGFSNVTPDRWLADVHNLFDHNINGLTLNYDPALRDNFDATKGQPLPDLWPLFDAMQGLPLALIRGANSNILSAQTTAEMRTRRPDMITATVPDRGHVPFLDEPDSLNVINSFLKAIP
ncbi:MAG: alpha/beta hydrolase [Rhodobacterales bacterium]|nr:alpha/beta hydrolase [Rhodobacterales bacterium]